MSDFTDHLSEQEKAAAIEKEFADKRSLLSPDLRESIHNTFNETRDAIANAPETFRQHLMMQQEQSLPIALRTVQPKPLDEITPEDTLRAEVGQMSWPQQAMISAGKETNDLMQGLKQIRDGFAYFMAPRPSDRRTKYQQEFLDRGDQIKEENKLYAPFSEGASIVPQMVGGMLPYLVSTSAVGPLVSKGIETVGSAFERPVIATGKKVGQASQAAITAAQQSPIDVVKAAGNKLAKDVAEPLSMQLTGMANRPPIVNLSYGKFGKRMASDTLLGAIESGVNPNQEAWQGALSSAIGTNIGTRLRPYVNRMPVLHNEASKDIRDWAFKRGMRIYPGVWSGNPTLMDFEGDLRAAERWSTLTRQIDNANAKVANRVAAKSMGMPVSKAQVNDVNFTPEILAEHKANLGRQFDELVKGTKGQFDRQSMTELQDQVNEIIRLRTAGNTSIRGASKTVHLIEPELNKLRQIASPRINPTTRQMTFPTIRGEDYQSLRSTAKESLNIAINTGNVSAQKLIGRFISNLDRAVENGINTKLGKVGVDEWKNLNSKYAVTKILMNNNAISPLGDVDLGRLSNFFRNDNPELYLLESSNPRIADMQKLAKWGELSKANRMGGGRTISPELQVNDVQRTLKNRITGMGVERIPLRDSAWMAAYMSHWPRKTGLLNMSNDLPFWNANTFTRSYAMGVPWQESLYNDAKAKAERGYNVVKGGVNATADWANDVIDKLESYSK